jgi:glucokinase
VKPYVLGIDLGGTHATFGLIRGETMVGVETLEFADHRALAPLLPRMTDTLHAFLNRHGVQPTEVAGIGLGFCGIVHGLQNRILSTNGKYEDAPSLDLIGWAQKSFGLPLRMENDARMALLGECYAGAARGETDVMMFTLGTGIGGVAMMAGKLLSGKHGQAGLLGGHVPVRIDGRPCTCGGRGCAETEAGGWALPLVCQEWPGFADSALARQEINFKNLFHYAAAGDRIAIEVREHCLKVWAMAAVAAIHSFDPDLLLYGGGVMRSGEIILPYIEQYVHRYTWTPWGKVRVQSAELGDRAALFGAVPLVREAESNTSEDYVR